MTSLIIFNIFLTLSGISYFFLKNTILCIIVSWWMFWLFISSLSITGLYSIGSYTYLIFISFLIFIVLGSLFEKFLLRYKSGQFFSTVLRKRYIYLYKFLMLILFLTFLYISVSLFIFKDSFNPTTYRSIIFSENSPLYANKYIDLFFSMILRPLYFACLFIGVACIVLYRDKKLFMLGLGFLVMISIAEFGRFALYIIIIMFIYLWIMGVKFNRFYFYTSLMLLLVLIIYISGLRAVSDEDLIELILYQYILNYHVFSFSIFNLDLNDATSRLHDMTLGFSSIFSIFDPLIILLRVFGLDILPETGVMAKSLDEIREIGMNNDGVPITANAFGSNLYGLYRDGGLLFVLVFGFGCGFFIQKMNRNLKSSIFNNGGMAAMFYFGMFGIFMPLVQFPWLIGFIYIKLFEIFFTKRVYGGY
jgi:oligosaccharide repeat unit polymerase